MLYKLAAIVTAMAEALVSVTNLAAASLATVVYVVPVCAFTVKVVAVL